MQSVLATRSLYTHVSIGCASQRLSCAHEHMPYHSLLAAEDSFLDKVQTAVLAEVEASDEEVDLAAAAAAADLARVAPGQGYLAPAGLP